MNMMGMSSSSDEQTTSTSYPFYVELDSSDGLMLGQHVYIERDIGQDELKEGLWLSDYYIVDAYTNEPYVWAVNDKKKLEKRYITLGKHDDDLGEYEIIDGLTKKDSIAFPTDALKEGETTEEGDITQTLGEGEDDLSMDMTGADSYAMPDDSVDMEPIEESSDEDVENFDDSEDTLDPNEDLIPMDEAPGISADEDTEGIQ